VDDGAGWHPSSSTATAAATTTATTGLARAASGYIIKIRPSRRRC